MLKEKKTERQPLNFETTGTIVGIAVGFKEIMELIHDVLAQRDVLMAYIVAFFILGALIVWGIRKIRRLHAALRFALPFLAVIAVIFGLSLLARIRNDPPPPPGQIFLEGVEVSLYAGNGAENVNEETGVGLREACFSGVSSLSVSDDTLYLADYSKLCIMENGTAILSDAQGGYGVQIVHCHDNSVYFLTDVWSDSEGTSDGEANRLYLGFVRIRDGEVSLLYKYEVGIAATDNREGKQMASFSDFAVASNGDIWFLEQNFGLDYAILNRLPYDSETDSYGLQEPLSSPIQKRDAKQTAQSRMAFDEEDNLYISLPEKGQILRVDSQTIHGKTTQEDYTVFAGLERTENSMPNPVDGADFTLCRPTSLACSDEYLLVVDFDMVRRIAIRDGQVSDCVTFAGKHDESERDIGIARGSGQEAEFVASDDEFLAVSKDGRVFLSDPEHNVIYLIQQTA